MADSTNSNKSKDEIPEKETRELFASFGFDNRKIDETLKNVHLTKSLTHILNEVRFISF